MLSDEEERSLYAEIKSKTAEQRFGKFVNLLVQVAKHTHFENSKNGDLSEGMRNWVLNKEDIRKKFHLKRSFSTHMTEGKLMLLYEFVRIINWILSHYSSEETRLKVLFKIANLLLCDTKENADYGWRPFSRPIDQLFEEMVERKVQERVARELRIRGWKKAQEEIGKG